MNITLIKLERLNEVIKYDFPYAKDLSISFHGQFITINATNDGYTYKAVTYAWCGQDHEWKTDNKVYARN